MKPLDLVNTPLEGINLIEASAGTGKTYAIEGLFLRLILEKQLRVDQILVVTFTKAATEELRDRIRNKLLQAERAFASGSSEDHLLANLLHCQKDHAEAVDLIHNALVSMDTASSQSEVSRTANLMCTFIPPVNGTNFPKGSKILDIFETTCFLVSFSGTNFSKSLKLPSNI